MKVAVIGCGAIANGQHIPAYVANEKAEIKYFCDIIPERAEAAVASFHNTRPSGVPQHPDGSLLLRSSMRKLLFFCNRS